MIYSFFKSFPSERLTEQGRGNSRDGMNVPSSEIDQPFFIKPGESVFLVQVSSSNNLSRTDDMPPSPNPHTGTNTVSERLFAPLGMNETYFSPGAADRETRPSPRWTRRRDRLSASEVAGLRGHILRGIGRHILQPPRHGEVVLGPAAVYS